MNELIANWHWIVLGSAALIAVLDVVRGALPNSWDPYVSLILSIAEKLQKFDVKKLNKPPGPPANSGCARVNAILWMMFASLVGAAVLMVGCANQPPADPWCSHVPKDSYSLICQAADKLGVAPESITSPIKIANAIAIGSDAYSAEQADAFIQMLIDQAKEMAFSDKGATWQQFMNYVVSKYDLLPQRMKAALIIVETLNNGDLFPGMQYVLLSQYDWAGILWELNQQKQTVDLFLQK
jgi:hypothetical protein